MSTWLMIGSSPSVLETLPAVKASLKNPTVITCNSGWKLWPIPDVYVVVDQVACVNYRSRAARIQAAGGKLVTLNRAPAALKQRHIDHYDEFLRIPGNGKPTRTKYGDFAYTGPLCVEYACHNGAKQIHLVGFDGYAPNTTDDHFDKGEVTRTCPERDAYKQSTKGHIEGRMRDLAEVWHDIEFIQYGSPHFTVGASNWTVLERVAS